MKCICKLEWVIWIREIVYFMLFIIRSLDIIKYKNWFINFFLGKLVLVCLKVINSLYLLWL